MKNKASFVAVIPARGGSKGIPRKNVALLKGHPLIYYPISLALANPRIERVIVSTDDKEIASMAESLGAEVPFIRPAELADDRTGDWPVFIHLIEELKKKEGYEFDYLINLRCTTPFKKAEHIDAAIDLILESGADSLRTVDRISGKHHPYWTFKGDASGCGVPFIDELKLSDYYQRQALPPAYSLNALVDIIKVEVILQRDSGNLYGCKMKLLETDPRYSMDIDTPYDLEICEFMAKSLLGTRSDGD